MSSANSKQVAGNHYSSGIQHWDFVVANELNYFEGQITKYVTRCRKKGQCIQDLQKAQHFLQKYIEILEAEERAKLGGLVDTFDQQFQAEVAASRRATGA